MESHAFKKIIRTFELGNGNVGKYFSLPELEKAGLGEISRLPVSLRLVLESVVRNCDGLRASADDAKKLAAWQPRGKRSSEIPFVVARILLQDFTGVPLLVDLAAMRSALVRLHHDPSLIEPLVPTELVIDHSVQVDYFGSSSALRLNTEMEFKRNQARYDFLKWGTQAFNNFKVIPPEIGIVHQVNLELLARGVFEKDGIFYPDSLVGTDSHTTMINGLGVIGWGVGGIEAEAGMLGQPVYFLTPDVVGFRLFGNLRPGVTATDLVLRVTEILRKAKVVGKFVEFFGEGASSLAVTDRATIANMAPEYGATIGFFPIDEECCRYLLGTGRTPEQVETFRRYYEAQHLFGMPKAGEIDYSETMELDLTSVEPSVAGPKRPQDRIPLTDLKERFSQLLSKPKSEGGYGILQAAARVPVKIGCGDVIVAGGGEQAEGSEPQLTAPQTSEKKTNPTTEVEMMNNRPTPDHMKQSKKMGYQRCDSSVGHGDIVIAAITSCTNTSNPSVMLAAGLMAKSAVEKGLSVPTRVKTSLAPGSRVVTDYLERTGLQQYLDKLGFHTVGYGCTTCIGNSGPIDSNLEDAIISNDLVVAAVLSGNRNFEARVHQSVKANFLMSPPLVLAFALAGRVNFDFTSEPLGLGNDKKPVYLKDIWPTPEEISQHMGVALNAETFKRIYEDVNSLTPLWGKESGPATKVYDWDPSSTYIREPTFFDNFTLAPPSSSAAIQNARALAILGDSVTTDHISPAGSIKASSPAGEYLQGKGVASKDFNSYGARRGNHEVMVRGTFANVRIQNLMVRGTEGSLTLHQPSGELMTIFDAAMRYEKEGLPLIIFAGSEYGTGSSRDWAAKGTRLLGVRAVIAKSFERIHRSNLVGMGVLPCQFLDGFDVSSLGLDGSESFSIVYEDSLRPAGKAALQIHRKSGLQESVPLHVRIDTPIELEYFRHGGILPFMLRQLINT